MFNKLGTNDIKYVLDYIGDDYLQCCYMYMDILKCGVENDGLGLWISGEKEAIRCAYYQYYD